MSGNTGLRGYIIQTLISLLDALKDDNSWETVTLEPMDESEKVDIRWKYPTSTKVCQVKSTQNVFKYKMAENWCQELEQGSPNANEYELILVGHLEEKLIKSNNIGKVKIISGKSIDTTSLIHEASNKIDIYYDLKCKPKIAPTVREILVRTLASSFETNAISGREVNRQEFDDNLLNWITAIEKQLEYNPYVHLASQSNQPQKEIGHRIVSKILELIGWKHFNEDVQSKHINEETGELTEYVVNFTGDIESKLKEKTDDFIFINAIHDITYPRSTKYQIQRYIENVDNIFKELQERKKIPIKRNPITEYYSCIFWFSTDNEETSKDFIFTVKDNFRNEKLDYNITYLLVDNFKANFLISSIITANNYRSELPVKFLYPITEANQNPGNIGQRGFILPPQYLNSAVIPIIKEDASKISVLLFCSDNFSPDHLKKLIWLLIKLTSGLGNDYIIYFPDYEIVHQNEARDVIRSFNDTLLNERIAIKKYDRVDAKILDDLPVLKTKHFNEDYDEKQLRPIDSKHLNEAFINILPYGDILKPFLKTDAITSTDLKIFLAKKGIYFKNADKNKIINLMSTLLFSPGELETFKAMIDIKDRKVNTTIEVLKIKSDKSLENAFKAIKPNQDNVTEDLQTRILSPVVFKINPQNPEEFIFTTITEKKDLTSQLSINTTWGKVEIIYKKEKGNLIVNTLNTITRDDKVIANRIIKANEEEFKRIDFVKEESIKLLFSSFKTNTERVQFLLSFMDVSSSLILKDPDITSVRFTFDENQTIPEKYQDKTDKDLITYFSGRNLAGLSEISDSEFKKILLLEEINIKYKFESTNINGFYSVKYNFSNALKMVPKDGIFKTEVTLYKSKGVKALKSIDSLEKTLAKEVERVKMEKLSKFNII